MTQSWAWTSFSSVGGRCTGPHPAIIIAPQAQYCLKTVTVEPLPGCMARSRCSHALGLSILSVPGGRRGLKGPSPHTSSFWEEAAGFYVLGVLGHPQSPQRGPKWVEAEKREGIGSRPWPPGVVRPGQARRKRKGDRAQGGPSSWEFPSSTASPC